MIVEQDVTKTSHDVFIGPTDARIASEYGIHELKEGWNCITYQQAKEIVTRINNWIPSVYYKVTKKRLKSIAGMIANGFGPDF